MRAQIQVDPTELWTSRKGLYCKACFDAAREVKGWFDYEISSERGRPRLIPCLAQTKKDSAPRYRRLNFVRPSGKYVFRQIRRLIKMNMFLDRLWMWQPFGRLRFPQIRLRA